MKNGTVATEYGNLDIYFYSDESGVSRPTAIVTAEESGNFNFQGIPCYIRIKLIQQPDKNWRPIAAYIRRKDRINDQVEPKIRETIKQFVVANFNLYLNSQKHSTLVGIAMNWNTDYQNPPPLVPTVNAHYLLEFEQGIRFMVVQAVEDDGQIMLQSVEDGGYVSDKFIRWMEIREV